MDSESPSGKVLRRKACSLVYSCEYRLLQSKDSVLMCEFAFWYQAKSVFHSLVIGHHSDALDAG